MDRCCGPTFDAYSPLPDSSGNHALAPRLDYPATEAAAMNAQEVQAQKWRSGN